VGLRTRTPELYREVTAALSEGISAAEIARGIGVSRRTVAAVRRAEICGRDVAQLRALQATRAREVADLAMEELRERLITRPGAVAPRELINAVRVAGEFARADEGPARAAGAGVVDDDAQEVLVLVRRRPRNPDGLEGDGGARAHTAAGPAGGQGAGSSGQGADLGGARRPATIEAETVPADEGPGADGASSH